MNFNYYKGLPFMGVDMPDVSLTKVSSCQNAI